MLNQHSLVRGRKISVPEIGPMTTVQELAMDSPAIPGRPPFHERSISAPGTSFRMHTLTDTCLYISSDDESPESRTASPKPWDERFTPPITTTEASSAFRGHRKGGSESSGIMDRGQPRKLDLRTNNCPIIRRTEPKRDKSSEQKAFERLPTGLKQADASEQLEQSELASLQRQALDQAGRFEVLKAADVEMLSKELRHLDERTEYLRRTYNALRVGRRNLHSRICHYLRSRVAKFSHESIMKQEEALAELDVSIDDWVDKLEQVENRRGRVRRKLLEHVAAAACLAVGGLTTTPEPPKQPQTNTLASGISNISTRPRSSLKETFTSASTASTSPSPQHVVARVLSTVEEQPIVEEATTRETEERVMSTASLKRADVESICIYAGDDVYALLADVKSEITRMSDQANEPTSTADMIEAKRIALHRQES